ncbi:vacuolar protein sorting-associated protein 62 [Tricladium varicosporioides]|nr:vacuolar protein sorting-associated protein 62 [Hymenoscyphus varicosporioides]
MSLGPWEKFIVTELETLNGLTRAELEEAIAKYGPILQLHKDEIYENCSVEWFLERSSLYDSKTNTTIVHPTAAQLPQAAAEEKRYWFTLEDRGKSGDLSTAKAYVRAYWNQGMTYTDLQFWFFSAYNGPGTAKVNGLLMDTIAHTGTANMAPMGEHVGDWEYCVIRVDNKGKHILKVILSQHGDAVTIEGKDLYKSFEMIDGTHPVIYSSRNGHAIYPSAGPNYTHYEKQPKGGIPAGIEFWLRNDTVKGGKSLESSKKYQVISADWLEGAEAISQPAWVNYRYRWGPEGTVTHMTSESVKEILSAALGWLSTLLPFVVTVSAAILPQFKKDDINGPGAPIIQGAWNGNY